MSTTQIAATLYQLQQLDLELDRLIAEQQAITTALQGNASLQKLRMAHNAAEQHLQASQHAQEEAEWALEDVKRRLSTKEKRLYSGTVSNPKELSVLQQDVQNLRAQHNRQEEGVLQMMDATEALHDEVRRQAQARQQAEDKWSQDNAAMTTHRDELNTRWQALQTKRAHTTASIDTALLARYEAMRRSKQGRAVSKVEQNSCQWCRVILTPSELQRVRISTELQQCSNCGRILYFDR